jgi:hypothetical protein
VTWAILPFLKYLIHVEHKFVAKVAGAASRYGSGPSLQNDEVLDLQHIYNSNIHIIKNQLQKKLFTSDVNFLFDTYEYLRVILSFAKGKSIL